jgi:hypothetical protein
MAKVYILVQGQSMFFFSCLNEMTYKKFSCISCQCRSWRCSFVCSERHLFRGNGWLGKYVYGRRGVEEWIPRYWSGGRIEGRSLTV